MEAPEITPGLTPEAFARRAWTLLIIRLVAVVVLTVLVWAVLHTTTEAHAFPPNTLWTTLVLFPVNVLCLVLVRRFYAERGLSLRQALGIQRGRVMRDLLRGLLWLMVMNIPFVIVVGGTMVLLYGAETATAFETVFFNPDSVVALHPLVMLMIALVTVLPFMLINAPTEELLYRGYALEGIAARRGGTFAVIATSVMFGAQHVVFAATIPGMLVYFLAFTVWGLSAAIIVRRQGRLFPVVIAHWIVNILLSSPGIVLPILLLTGMVPTT